MSTITEKELESKIEKLTDTPYTLIVHNDEFNTFDHVIECLMVICGHTYEQASQCSLCIHYKQKCDVKRGNKDTLTFMKEKLQENHLTASIEKSI